MGAAAHHAELCLRRPEERPLHGDGDVCSGGIAEAAAQAVPMDRADQGYPQLIERLRAVVIDLLGVGDILVQDALIETLDIHAHAERLDVGVHDTHPDVVLVVDIVTQQQDLFLHHAVRRVHRRVVERHDGDVILHGQKHLLQGVAVDGFDLFGRHLTDPPCHSVHSKLPTADPGTWGGRC